jgi:nucleoside-diphosphate-sugar epimerase
MIRAIEVLFSGLTLDTRPIRAELGWFPRVPIRAGLQATLAAELLEPAK